MFYNGCIPFYVSEWSDKDFLKGLKPELLIVAFKI